MLVDIEKLYYIKELCPHHFRSKRFDKDKIIGMIDDFDNLPPVTVVKLSKPYILIDGYHRMLVHRFIDKKYIDIDVKDDFYFGSKHDWSDFYDNLRFYMKEIGRDGNK